DVGFGRTGVQSPQTYADVAAACRRFRGIFYYPSNFDTAAMQRAALIIRDCVKLRPAEIVSGGSTPTAGDTPLIPETTEIRAGTYVFNDAGLIARNIVKKEDCALRILVSVVSTA